MQVPGAELARALRQVTPAASTDDNRPIITGVLLAAEEGGLRLVATDSYRLAVRDLAGITALGDRPQRARAEPGAEGGRAGRRRPPRRSPCASASATPPSRSAPPASPPA